METKFKKKPKQPKAIWTRAFPDQLKALHPETGPAGGIKARSGAETVRMAVYRPIAEMFKHAHPLCQCCEIIRLPFISTQFFERESSQDVHHCAGREGYLLFDIRHWKAACRVCHDWIHTHQEEAARLKLLYTL